MVSQRKRAQGTVGGTLSNLRIDVDKALSPAPAAANGSVGPAALIKGAVGPAALAVDAVTSESLGRGAVGTENLGIVNEVNSDSVLQLNAPIGIVLGGDAYPAPTQNSTLSLDPTGALVVDAAPVPLGAIIAYALTTAPAGWLLCNGGTASRTDYPALFALVGITFGAGDGSTTFGLPNYTGMTLHYIIKAL